MTTLKEIGGYFERDPGNGNTPLPNGILFNSGRNALRHIVRALGVKRIHVPYYTCPVVWDALKAEGCEMMFYEIDSQMYPKKRFSKDDFVLYTNYFGCCGGKVDNLASDYKNLIVDCAQAYYAKPKGVASFSSPRKFFGVPDGGVAYGVQLDSGCLYEADDSSRRCAHLNLRAEGRTAEGYEFYRASELSLDGAPVLAMSKQSREMLSKVDAESARIARMQNFNFLNEFLKSSFPFELSADDVPMVYSFVSEDLQLRQKLIAKKIFVATYWHGADSIENLHYRIIPLPIDQRYDVTDMKRVVEMLYNKE